MCVNSRLVIFFFYVKLIQIMSLTIKKNKAGTYVTFIQIDCGQITEQCG